jgi:hypothetical protein
MAKDYLKETGKTWKVDFPRAWDIPLDSGGEVGPHVSLSFEHHKKDVGKRVELVVDGIRGWTENSRWVALFLKGHLIDSNGWHLHLSIAQQLL